MTTCEKYWRKTGAKFLGSDEELEELMPDCNNSMPITDEEGFFSKFYCCIDWSICDKQCSKHNPKIDEDWKPFIDSVNQRFRQCG
jgi:hypothetical protein